ncbi:MAG: hypothetical protein WCH86_03465 [Kiritimatiellales bacterium]
MRYRHVVLMLFIATLAGAAQALLPPDAKARVPELRAYYQKVRDDYEIKQTEFRAELARAREQAEVDIRTPPWMRGEQAALQSEANVAAAADKTHKRISHVLISIIFLSLIVGGAGWVWYKTRQTDG